MRKSHDGAFESGAQEPMTHAATENMQEEIATWVRLSLGMRGESGATLARNVGMDPSSMSRALSNKRAFSMEEVAKIAHHLGSFPPAWNKIRRLVNGDNLLPLMGRVNSGVWRVKGPKMPKGFAPIRPIPTGRDDEDRQVSYSIEDGLYAGKMAIGYMATDQHRLIDNAMVIVEESMIADDPTNVELTRLTLRRAKVSEAGVQLVPLDNSLGLEPISMPSDCARVEALIHWVLVPVSEREISAMTP